MKTVSLVFKVVGWFIAAAAAVTIVWQLATYFNNTEHRTEKIEGKLETIIDTQGVQQSQQDSILYNINKLNGNVKKLTLSSDNLENYMMRHSTSQEELLEVLEIWDIKKNKKGNLGEIALDK